MSAADALHGRWRALWSGDAVDGDAIYRDLVARYAEPHRAYHTLDHVADCLHWLDEVRPLLARPDEAEWAIWFHDAVYDPQRADNEERSAALAAEALTALAVDAAVGARVADLIRLTSHTTDALTADGAVVCDIDLAILGAPPQRFEQYDAAIRQEYAWVPEAIFRRERERVLAGFLDRPRIYHTFVMSEKCERRARVNIAQLLLRYQGV